MSSLSYELQMLEHSHYPWANWRRAKGCSSILYPGCGFMSNYPKTTAALAHLLQQEAGIGVAYDCCGAPLAGAKRNADNARVQAKHASRLQSLGVREIVTVCPNCAQQLAKLDPPVRITSVYQKLHELGLGKNISNATNPVQLFVPCPDRSSHAWLTDVARFCPNGYTLVKKAPCCGLADWSLSRGTNYAQGLAAKALAACNADQPLIAYCASCAGWLARNATEAHSPVTVQHALPLILGIDETPGLSNTLLSRMKKKLA